ncbi:bifunctional 23S rRNA (guanine(2069)-N(7))-methyltransferase RlmK/23S rRNA (guanine(2445)-N(2))-methyltransferase RlmL [Salicola sp. Rm-C-2C1-2]|uniref:bifunctional 23S rRNA (guanine(2069)-N(7))-methyltransferase RlmK/23S rRNA (guanine(2445)-N(2))-methyltransferase RlmL n=1 Tax=Salicola sp. Rm-C-2C1-2 TaxID=3141321 RepID=UPI0032E37B4E
MNDFFVTASWGLIELLADEVAALGHEVSGRASAGLWVRTDMAGARHICLWSRLASRVILHLTRAQADSADTVREAAAAVPWEQWLDAGMSFRVRFQGTYGDILSPRFGAQCVKDGLMERVRARSVPEPVMTPSDPDLPIRARLRNGQLELGLDMAGEGLHQRGYRTEAGEAPLRETLAAGLLHRAGWPEKMRAGGDLADPFCGSGTILIEAAMMATDTAPGLYRDFAFERWPQSATSGWPEQRAEAHERRRQGLATSRIQFRGTDVDKQVVAVAWRNIERAGFSDRIHVEKCDVADWRIPDKVNTGLILTNPPYGNRLETRERAAELFRVFGERLRNEAEGWHLGLLLAEPELGHQLGVRARRQYRFYNGSLETTLLLFEIQESDFRQPQQSLEELRTGIPEPEIYNEERAAMLANRLRKNRRHLRRRINKTPEQAHCLYDADIPEYAVRITQTGHHLAIREYAPPASVPEKNARQRLAEVLAVAPQVLGIEADAVSCERRGR